MKLTNEEHRKELPAAAAIIWLQPKDNAGASFFSLATINSNLQIILLGDAVTPQTGITAMM